jgi:hypothetical protein
MPIRPAGLRAAATCAALVLGACGPEPAGPEGLPPFGRVIGEVVAPGIDVFGDLTARVTWDGMEVASAVQPDGSFELDVPYEVTGFGFLTIEPVAGEGLHPAWVILSPAELDVRTVVVVAPTTWTIEAGDYAGQTVPIDPALAADPSVLPSYWGFYFPFEQDGFDQTVTEPGEWLGELWEWPESAYPIPLALDRAGSDARFARADSVALWQHVDRMERALGWDAFRPARIEDLEVRPGERRADGAILVQVDTALGVPGVGLTGRADRAGWSLSAQAGSWSGGDVEFVSFSSGDVAFGHVRVSAPAHLRESRLVIHELMHTLGVGHGCAWRSVQTYCGTLAADVPTAADVAHLQVLRRMRTLEHEHDTRWGVIAAVFGRRVVSLGLPPVPSRAGVQAAAAASH